VGGVLDQTGVALLEVLVTAVVVSIAAAGLALMYAFGNTWVVSKGDDRVALSLAQQKIEQLRSLGFGCIFVGGPATYSSTTTPLVNCPLARVEQSYDEQNVGTWTVANSLQGNTRTAGPPPTEAPDLRFRRRTCVEYVNWTALSTPAYEGGTTGTPCNTNPPAAPGVQLTPLAKRITVIVQPTAMRQTAGPVVLEAWITAVPGGL
jgi:Tfp pilus assembly protein PilV